LYGNIGIAVRTGIGEGGAIGRMAFPSGSSVSVRQLGAAPGCSEFSR
jgi:hypothetical protein